MNEKNVVIAGGSGFLGRSLAAALIRRDCRVTVLTRTPAPSEEPAIREVGWDGRSTGPWTSALEGASALVNLTGRSVNCRYTRENRGAIIESRVESVRALDGALRACANPPPVWIQAGSLAIHGDAGNRVCDEASPAGDGFPVEVCRKWEEAFESAVPDGTRKVLMRIGFVLGTGGGALTTLAALTRWCLGGPVGSGRQFISWIHLDDMNALWSRALEDPSIAGVYNATGPNPVTNAEFMRELRRTLHRPWSPPVPALVARVGAWAMGTEASLALSGRRCIPKRFAEAGFIFRFPELGPALADLLRNPTPTEGNS